MRRDIKKKLLEKMAKSTELHERGMKHLASFYTTGPFGFPKHILYFKKGKGSRVVDADGNEYVDFCMGIGPVILGHASDVVLKAIEPVLQGGVVHGMGHEHEVRLAELVCECAPGAEVATFCNSGTEATLHAIRMARALTGKDMIAKFEGAYHGVHDYAQISSRAVAQGPPEAPESATGFGGIPQCIKDMVLTLSYNYDQSLERIRAHAHKLAAVIVEPVPTVCPIDFSPFLRELRRVTAETGVVLIFDEVLSGFRMALGGAQEKYGIQADLVAYGKIMGGGFPVGAIAGKRQFMDPIITTGNAGQDVGHKVFITGTFSGNPVTCAAGVAVLEYLRDHRHEVYPRLEQIATRIRTEIGSYADKIGFPVQFLGVSSWLQVDFQKKDVKYVRDVNYRSNVAQFELMRRSMLLHGIILGDVPVLFPSLAHSDADVTKFIQAFQEWMDERTEK